MGHSCDMGGATELLQELPQSSQDRDTLKSQHWMKSPLHFLKYGIKAQI